MRTTLSETLGTVVVGDLAQQPLAAARLSREDLEPLQHPLSLEPDHHHGALLHALRPLVRLADVERREVQDRRLLGDRAAVGEHGPGLDLQA